MKDHHKSMSELDIEPSASHIASWRKNSHTAELQAFWAGDTKSLSEELAKESRYYEAASAGSIIVEPASESAVYITVLVGCLFIVVANDRMPADSGPVWQPQLVVYGEKLSVSPLKPDNTGG